MSTGSEETTTAAQAYLDGVRAALADLPAAEVDEILDDVRGHLDELTAELGEGVEPLTTRLGTPADYAAELRAAAGYPAAAPVAATSPWPARWALAGILVGAGGLALGTLSRNPLLVLIGVLAPIPALALIARDGKDVPSVAALPVVRRFVGAVPPPGSAARAVTDFLASLQPAWWLLRAVVAGLLVGALFGDLLAAAVLAVVGVPVSVWLGFASKRDRRWLWLVVPLNALAVALVPLALDGWNVPGGHTRATAYRPPAGLYQDDGRPIRDIRPVDAFGNPLTGVYLFDQDGRPIDARAVDYCYDPYPTAASPTGPDLRPYPRGTREEDPATGRCHTVPPRPLVVAVPQPTPSAAAPTSAPTSAPTTAPPAAAPTG
ncbi:DUF1700 domain-containing protein [Pseudonocardia sp. CA-107938]|uniref:DUF1700 domain-containing protein n=1 Tax=Pseudonocardia sp. CA-107938 TaxID=3240021 RepID=UPI003D8F1211